MTDRYAFGVDGSKFIWFTVNLTCSIKWPLQYAKEFRKGYFIGAKGIKISKSIITQSVCIENIEMKAI